MNRRGYDFLAGTALTVKYDTVVGWRHKLYLPVKLSRSRSMAHKKLLLGGGFAAVFRRWSTIGCPRRITPFGRLLQCPADHIQDLFRDQRLGYIIECPGFDNVHGGLDIGIASNNDDDGGRGQLLYFPQYFPSFLVPKPEITQDDIKT